MPCSKSHPVPITLGKNDECQRMVVPPAGVASRSTSPT